MSARALQLRAGSVANYLGPARYEPERVYAQDEVGLVRGLAWTSVGGEVLDVEVAVLDGTGKLELTGNLGNVMKESAAGRRHLYPQPCTAARHRPGVL